MANPQPTDAHLRIAHQISEQLMVSHFTAKQRRILDLILRLSWGCGKKVANIPRQKDFEVVGIEEGHIKEELDVLTRDNIIFREGNLYSFNKNFDNWRVSRARKYHPQKLTELVSLNLKNLPNREVGTYRIGKKSLTESVSPSDTKLAMPKESTKERLKKDMYAHFEKFWAAYPKRKSKGAAERVFFKLNPDEQLLATMLATIERAKKSADWQKEDGRYIPHPATWLNARGWEDEYLIAEEDEWNPRG